MDDSSRGLVCLPQMATRLIPIMRVITISPWFIWCDRVVAARSVGSVCMEGLVVGIWKKYIPDPVPAAVVSPSFCDGVN